MSSVLDIRFKREIYNRGLKYGIRIRPCSSLLHHQGLYMYQVCITEVMSSGNVTYSTRVQ